ncbi:MAG: DUF1801 domain-containing protein [Ginsengibacter sp.]
MKTYTTVEEYLNDVPADKLAVLEKLRKTIRSVVPKAEEYISYGMPTFKYHGPLVSYAAFKEHCSLFPWNSTLIKKFAGELKNYKTSKGTIQFTVEKQLPPALVKKLIKERAIENEKRLLAKKNKKK